MLLREKATKPAGLPCNNTTVRLEDGERLRRFTPLVGVEQHDACLAEITIDEQRQVAEVTLVRNGARTCRNKDEHVVFADA